VIEIGRRPVVCAVTLFARDTECAFVVIVLLVAGQAVGFEGDLRRGLDVTILAARRDVFSDEGKLGLRVVKFRNVPIICRVARGAVLTQSVLMHILVPVARNAGRRYGVALIRMTVLTLGTSMSAGERKLRLPVIEPEVPPLHTRVTCFAARAEIAFVLVVSPMAGNAGGW
jgi:hypothetical protein